MRFLVVGRFYDEAQTAEFHNLHEAEGKALWELYGAGILREARFGREMSCAAFVFECRTRAEAEQFLKTLPSSKTALVDYRISELTEISALTEQFRRHHSTLPAWLR